ncbi:hypothetical protein RUM43_007662 [Polyplax serrata]|uniref:Uncharacterized protein n=1 Tax=Polyplax serrata TaxID=468196 RepID=A0AAN8P677_POLSC
MKVSYASKRGRKQSRVDKVTPPALSTTGLTPPPEKRRRESPDLGAMDQTMALALTQSTDSVNAAVEEEVSTTQLLQFVVHIQRETQSPGTQLLGAHWLFFLPMKSFPKAVYSPKIAYT